MPRTVKFTEDEFKTAILAEDEKSHENKTKLFKAVAEVLSCSFGYVKNKAEALELTLKTPDSVGGRGRGKTISLELSDIVKKIHELEGDQEFGTFQDLVVAVSGAFGVSSSYISKRLAETDCSAFKTQKASGGRGRGKKTILLETSDIVKTVHELEANQEFRIFQELLAAVAETLGVSTSYVAKALSDVDCSAFKTQKATGGRGRSRTIENSDIVKKMHELEAAQEFSDFKDLVAAAAEALQVSTTTISNRLRELEDVVFKTPKGKSTPRRGRAPSVTVDDIGREKLLGLVERLREEKDIRSFSGLVVLVSEEISKTIGITKRLLTDLGLSDGSPKKSAEKPKLADTLPNDPEGLAALDEALDEEEEEEPEERKTVGVLTGFEKKFLELKEKSLRTHFPSRYPQTPAVTASYEEIDADAF